MDDDSVCCCVCVLFSNTDPKIQPDWAQNLKTSKPKAITTASTCVSQSIFWIQSSSSSHTNPYRNEHRPVLDGLLANYHQTSIEIDDNLLYFFFGLDLLDQIFVSNQNEHRRYYQIEMRGNLNQILNARAVLLCWIVRLQNLKTLHKWKDRPNQTKLLIINLIPSIFTFFNCLVFLIDFVNLNC